MGNNKALLVTFLFTSCASQQDYSTNEHSVSAAGGSINKIDRNPKCSDFGKNLDVIKLNSPNAGEHTLTIGDGSITLEISQDETNFDWHSTIGVDAIIVKTGPTANVYSYSPELSADSGLHAPLNHRGNGPILSHISICYDNETDPINLCKNVSCDGGLCGEAGVCNPESGTCEYQSIEAAGTLCRQAVGDCDITEFCTGESPQCPNDELEEEGILCAVSNAAGFEGVEMYCTGDSGMCPLPEGHPIH